MSEPEKTPNYVTRESLSWLERRVDRLADEMREQCRNHARRIRLFVRILVDKKIIGEEVAKSIEETLPDESKALLDWFNGELEILKKELEETKTEK